jgi:hypothetical protein
MAFFEGTIAKPTLEADVSFGFPASAELMCPQNAVCQEAVSRQDGDFRRKYYPFLDILRAIISIVRRADTLFLSDSFSVLIVR